MTGRGSRLTDGLFFACLFTATFEKVYWEIAGAVQLVDVLTAAFVGTYALGRIGRPRRPLPRTHAVLGGFLLLFLLVYLVGYFNLETQQAVQQFVKGLVKFFLHYGFLLVGLAYLVRRGEAFYWRALGWFMGGIAVNAVYGVAQLAVAQSGANLDDVFVNPITGGASRINLYGAVEGTSIYRPNALTGDPNHLGIVLLLPLLVLTPVYLRLERGHRLRTRLAWLLAFLLLVELLTLSRSGLLGLAAGFLVLLVPYRHRLAAREVVVPVAAVALVLAAVAVVEWHYVETVVRARFATGDRSTSTHLGVYGFIPEVLRLHPLFGLGLYNFSVYYELVTGRTNWGPHSFFVALFVDTGIVGVLAYALFLGYFFVRLRVTACIGRLLAAQRDAAAARVRPLAWGLGAALVATIAANSFYLTMTFFYFYVFAALLLAAPIVFGRRARANGLPA